MTGLNDRRPARVIVGVSGSLANLSALHVAADAARATGLTLLAVTAWLPPGGNTQRWGSASIDFALQELAAGQLATAFVDAFGAAPTDIDLDARVICGDTVPVLTACATHPRDLLVVGASRSGFARLWLGSVSERCARHSPCPVMIVPRPVLLDGLRAVRRQPV